MREVEIMGKYPSIYIKAGRFPRKTSCRGQIGVGVVPGLATATQAAKHDFHSTLLHKSSVSYFIDHRHRATSNLYAAGVFARTKLPNVRSAKVTNCFFLTNGLRSPVFGSSKKSTLLYAAGVFARTKLPNVRSAKVTNCFFLTNGLRSPVFGSSKKSTLHPCRLTYF